MFPQLRLTPARAAFARPGPRATAFPDVNALMQPSDSLAPFGRRSGHPSPAAYLGAEVLFFTAAPVPPPTGATPETFLPRLPISRLSTRGKNEDIPGAWAILFVRAVVYDPAGYVPPLAHLSVRSLLPSGDLMPWAPGNIFLSWLHGPRPTRSRAYASPNPLPSPAPGSLPAGRAHPWPGGFRTRWMTNKVS